MVGEKRALDRVSLSGEVRTRLVMATSEVSCGGAVMVFVAEVEKRGIG